LNLFWEKNVQIQSGFCGLIVSVLFWTSVSHGMEISDLFKAADDTGYIINSSGQPELYSPATANSKQAAMGGFVRQGICSVLWINNVPRLLVKVSDAGAFITDFIDQDGKPKRIYTCAPGDIFVPIAFINGGKSFYALSNRQSEFARLIEINCVDGSERVIHTDPENKVDLGGIIIVEKTEPKLKGVYYIDDRIRYYFFDDEFTAMHKLVTAKLPAGDILWDSGSDNGRQWVIRHLSDSVPATYYCFNFDTKELKLLPAGKYSSLITIGETATIQPMSYKSRDGNTLYGYLTIPPGSNGKHLPVVVFVHGGPASRVFRWFDPRVQALATAGYAVFQPNYRGSRGFGKHYMTAGWKNWGTGTLQNDITDGVRHLISEGIAQPEKIAIMGGSFGGYCALAGLAFTPELYAAGIDIFGISDLVSYLREVQDEQKPLQPMDRVMCGDINNPADLSRLKSQSPINFADKIHAPLLIYHGAKDDLIKPEQSDKIAAALIAKSKVVEYCRNQKEAHGFSTPEAEAGLYCAVLSFLNKHIGK